MTTLVALGAFLAAVFLTQGPAMSGVAAAPAHHAVAAPRTIILRPACDSADISQVYSPQVPGAQVALIFSSTGCLTPVYRFLVLAPGTTTWVFKTAYSASSTYTFDVTGAKDGVWQIGVWAKDVASTARYQAWSINSFNIATPYCTGAYLAPSLPSPVAVGTSITFAGNGIGCPAPTFDIWKLSPGSSTWVLVKPYSTAGSSIIWNTTGLARGAYRWLVKARQQGSLHGYDTYGTLTYWLT